ncbi:hypothetical protein [Dyella mobilis]|uniref:Uncharacterized protein n=1 Tax=Dyella mobilis TaxID=1849582 RepID=A0ABS2KB86_9GAMM|nr:hypothetical protein [Dyella mobilis]MBM7128426.1 hypothetical protein [Dyella mobilis]GLQ99731.1 hypothetical protein GCM10007863_41510 [Dyella mobilis]
MVCFFGAYQNSALSTTPPRQINEETQDSPHPRQQKQSQTEPRQTHHEEQKADECKWERVNPQANACKSALLEHPFQIKIRHIRSYSGATGPKTTYRTIKPSQDA